MGENFIKLYNRTYPKFVKLGISPTNALQFLDIAGYMTYPTKERKWQQLILTGETKLEICSDLDITPGRLSHLIKLFTEKNLLKKIDTVTYVVNPYFVTKSRNVDLDETKRQFDLLA